ncbi:MAG TPA: hypothetical protein V6C88_10365 [Chroococcidiopsis sp.]
MDINLRVEPNDSVRVFVNGSLAAEVCVNELDGIPDFARELDRSRRLEKLPFIFKSHIKHLIDGQNLWEEGFSKERCRVEYSRGLIDGFQKKTIAHPEQKNLPLGQRELLPGIPPDSYQTYRMGYDHGIAIARILEVLDHGATNYDA